MKILATFAVASALLVMGCHNNKPAATPVTNQQPAAPAPVQGPPP